MKVDIKPFVAVVSDYHEFDAIVESFKFAGISLMFEEIVDFMKTEYSKRAGYHAVFWVKDCSTKEFNIAQALIRELQERSLDND